MIQLFFDQTHGPDRPFHLFDALFQAARVSDGKSDQTRRKAHFLLVFPD
jgi:hypothetical protein